MEALLVKPRDERAMDALMALFREMKGSFTSQVAAETLEGKMLRLYEEGYYTDSEMEEFFSIPKEHRADPFEVIEDGDVHWADKRNVERTIAEVRQAKKDKAEGRSISFESVGELDAYIRSL